MTILDEILARKRDEVAQRRNLVSAEELAERAAAGAPDSRGFRRALEAAPFPAVIAELKRQSPSRGVIRADFDPVACAEAYEQGGAAALSVLTDEPFFGGRLEYLSAIRAKVDLPLLRKDFLIDPSQIDEARCAGADAVLRIVAALEDERLEELLRHAAERGLDALVEVHDRAEAQRARNVGARLVGVNNRNLATFEVDLGTTEQVAEVFQDDLAVLLGSESGILTPGVVARLAAAGASAFLVGESLMVEPDPGEALTRLRRVV